MINWHGFWGAFLVSLAGVPVWGQQARAGGWTLSYELRKGEELRVSVFPPRPYNWKRANEDLMAHEGNESPYVYPSTALIQSTARYCKVMVVHSWFWPGGDREPWKIPTFVPKDRRQFDRVRDDLHWAGMKMVPYFSPYYYGQLERIRKTKKK